MKKSILLFCLLVMMVFVSCDGNGATDENVSAIPTWLQGSWDVSMFSDGTAKTSKAVVITQNKITSAGLTIFDQNNATYTAAYSLTVSGNTVTVKSKQNQSVYYSFTKTGDSTVSFVTSTGVSTVTTYLFKSGTNSGGDPQESQKTSLYGTWIEEKGHHNNIISLDKESNFEYITEVFSGTVSIGSYISFTNRLELKGTYTTGTDKIYVSVVSAKCDGIDKTSIFQGFGTLEYTFSISGKTMNASCAALSDDLILTKKESAGGYLIYDKGSYSNGWRYMETTTSPVSGYYGWGSYSVTGTKTGIGTGKENTELMPDYVGTSQKYSAAYACKTCDFGGYKDWFLPSKDEVDLIYQLYSKGTISGGFAVWSSSLNSTVYSGGTKGAWTKGFGYEYFEEGQWVSSDAQVSTGRVFPVRRY